MATKVDKVPPSKQAARKTAVATACALPPDGVDWVRTTKGTGLEDLMGKLIGVMDRTNLR